MTKIFKKREMHLIILIQIGALIPIIHIFIETILPTIYNLKKMPTIITAIEPHMKNEILHAGGSTDWTVNPSRHGYNS
jgi:hypothetical protein